MFGSDKMNLKRLDMSKKSSRTLKRDSLIWDAFEALAQGGSAQLIHLDGKSRVMLRPVKGPSDGTSYIEMTVFKKLIAADLVIAEKTGSASGPMTSYKLAEEGRKMYRQYLEYLEKENHQEAIEALRKELDLFISEKQIRKEQERYTRLYADGTGELYFENEEIKLEPGAPTPLSESICFSNYILARRCVFWKAPVGWKGKFELTAAPSFYFVISGAFEIHLSKDRVRRFKEKDILLVEDSDGEGYTVTVSEEPVLALCIELVE